MNAKPILYTVIVTDGEVCDRELRPIAPAIRKKCGHNHLTYEAAEECWRRLRNRRCSWCGSRSGIGQCRAGGGGHSMAESAAWYNATIHPHAGDSMDYIPRDEQELRQP